MGQYVGGGQGGDEFGDLKGCCVADDGAINGLGCGFDSGFKLISS